VARMASSFTLVWREGSRESPGILPEVPRTLPTLRLFHPPDVGSPDSQVRRRLCLPILSPAVVFSRLCKSGAASAAEPFCSPSALNPSSLLLSPSRSTQHLSNHVRTVSMAPSALCSLVPS